jgi:hypothetical protein
MKSPWLNIPLAPFKGGMAAVMLIGYWFKEPREKASATPICNKIKMW